MASLRLIEILPCVVSAAYVAVSVNPSIVGNAVSLRVFGVNGNLGTIERTPAVPYPLYRWGGNAVTRYNYVYDVSNQ
jgi:hypothetical protein